MIYISQAPNTSSSFPQAKYVCISTDPTLTNERVLAVGAGISINDAGAGNNVTLTGVPDVPNLDTANVKIYLTQKDCFYVTPGLNRLDYGLELPHGLDHLSFDFRVPACFSGKKLKIYVTFAPYSTIAANVALNTQILSGSVGNIWYNLNETLAKVYPSIGTADVLKTVNLGTTAGTVSTNDLVNVRITRDGTDGGDTYLSGIYVHGVIIEAI